MTDAEDARETDGSFGEALEAFLVGLTERGVAIGPKERLTVETLAIELLARGRIHTFKEFRPYLAAVLTHAPDQAVYFGIGAAEGSSGEPTDQMDPARADDAAHRAGGVASEVRSLLRAEWHRLGLAVATLTLIGALVWAYGPTLQAMLTPPTVTTPDFPTPEPPPPTTSPPSVGSPAPLPPSEGPTATVARVLEASLPFHGAPTLGELASALELPPELRTTPAQLARALSELTGLPLRQPLDLIDARVQAAPRLAQALDRIVRPDAAGPLEGYRITDDALDGLRARIFARLGAATPDDAGLAAARGRAVAALEAGVLSEAQARLLAASGAPLTWRERRRWTSVVAPTPAWVPPAATAAPILLGLLVLWLRFRAQVGVLRRRRPKHAPQMTEFVSDVLQKAVRATDLDRRLAQVLQTREERPFPKLDIRRTVTETIRAGGRITLCEERVRPVPEYLVLLEEPQPSDHVARRMRDLFAPLLAERLLHFDVYRYQQSPSVLYSEAGAAFPIEAVHAKHPQHRVIVLGSGHGLIAALDGRPTSAVKTLRLWERRALLTPLPLSEWGELEFQIAEALDAPIGRATRSGFQTIGELLGLEGPPPEPLPNSRGDGRLARLPEIFRDRPERLLRDDAVSESRQAEVLATVRHMLDRDGFRWLAALAVFPSLQWDITLYLGLTLPSERDVLLNSDDPDHMTPCFQHNALGDRRMAALARLPWLRAGRMPLWLRRGLIQALSERDKWHVHQALNKAMGDPQEARRPAPLSAHEFRLKIGRDPGRDPLRGRRPADDALLFEFMRRGDAGDYQAPPELERFFAERYPRPIERFLLEGRNQRLAVTALVAGLAAWWAAPAAGASAPTGAWWPLALVALGAALALALEALPDLRARGVFRASRTGRRGASAPTASPPPAQPQFAPLSRFRDPMASGGEGPEMVVIPAGDFLMGSPEDEPERMEREGPQHRVTIAQPFAMGRYAVTFDEYDAFCAATGREKPDDRGWGRGRRPVINVSWEDATAYCAWLSEQTGAPYRLPSEAEWEYACRAETTTRYSFGDDTEALGKHAWFIKNSGHRTQPVGGKLGNAFDLCDMHGNVLEWCADIWNDHYEGAPTDGSAWSAGETSAAVLRGGSWISVPGALRSAVRSGGGRGLRGDDLGFRVARVSRTLR